MKDPVCQNLEHLLYTTSRPDDTSHNCVIVIDKHIALTSHHENLTENQVVTIYNVLDSNVHFECVVDKISVCYDLVCLKLIDGEFPVVPRRDGSIYEGRKYMMVGVDAQRCPIWRDGVISERNVEDLLVHYVGTSEGDFPGAGIFDDCGNYLGIVIGKRFEDPTSAESADNKQIHIIGNTTSIVFCEIGEDDPSFQPCPSHTGSTPSPRYSHTPDNWQPGPSPTYVGASPGFQESPTSSARSSTYRFPTSPAYSAGSPEYTGLPASPTWSYT